MKLEKISYQAGINVVCFDGHVWVTAKQIEEMLETTKRVVSYHINELEELNQFVAGKHVMTLPITRMEGTNEVTRNIRHYSELAVIRIGFRLNSPKALTFQEWAADALLTLKREGVVYDTSVKPTSDLSEIEKWDYSPRLRGAATHDLLDALNIPPMKNLVTRIGLLISQSRPKLSHSPQKQKEEMSTEEKLEQDKDRALRLIGKLYQKNGVWPTMTQIKKRTGPYNRRWTTDYLTQILLALQTKGLIEEFMYEDKLKRNKRFKLSALKKLASFTVYSFRNLKNLNR